MKKKGIRVKKPKKGRTYLFEFAGSEIIGVLQEENEVLTKYYSHPRYIMLVEAKHSPIFEKGTYPASIHSIIKEIR